MSTTLIPVILDALVAACVAAQATTLSEVVIYDGPMPSGPTAPAVLLIGGEWIPSEPGRNSVTGTQVSSRMGNNSREEEIRILCAAISQAGDPDMRARRELAFAIVAAVEDILTASPNLGGARWVLLSSVDSVQQLFNDRGAACAVNFSVTASSLIWNG